MELSCFAHVEWILHRIFHTESCGVSVKSFLCFRPHRIPWGIKPGPLFCSIGSFPLVPEEILADNWHGFLRVRCPSCQQTVSNRWRKLKALTQTGGMASSLRPLNFARIAYAVAVVLSLGLGLEGVWPWPWCVAWPGPWPSHCWVGHNRRFSKNTSYILICSSAVADKPYAATLCITANVKNLKPVTWS